MSPQNKNHCMIFFHTGAALFGVPLPWGVIYPPSIKCGKHSMLMYSGGLVGEGEGWDQVEEVKA